MKNITQSEKYEKAYEEKKIEDSTDAFCKRYKVGANLKRSNAYKAKGFAVMLIFCYLLRLIFTKKSMYMNIVTGTHDQKFKKDVVYRFLDSPNINWDKFILSTAKNVIEDIDKLTSEARISVISIDDTFYGRGRSKKVELLANVYDHASKGQKYKRGFRQLTATWTDGVTLVPLCFRHMSTENKKNRYNEINEKIDKRTCGYKARKQAISTMPATMLEMLRQIVSAKIPSKHVVFDSWFSNPSTMIGIKKLGLDVVGRLKNSRTIKYIVNGKEMTLSQIYGSAKKRRGRSKYLLSVPVQLYVKDNKGDYAEVIDSRIVFVKDRSNKKKWIAFLSTDMALSEEQVIEAYGKRWDIEVFFKMCKSYLKLGSEFQGLSYDSITAHTAVVMIRYMILAVQKRQNEDPRSFGELFFSQYDEKLDMQFAEVLALILDLLREVLMDLLFLSDKQMVEIIDAFISKLPEFLKRNLVPKVA